MMIIPAGSGKAVELLAGQHARIGLPEGMDIMPTNGDDLMPKPISLEQI